MVNLQKDMQENATKHINFLENLSTFVIYIYNRGKQLDLTFTNPNCCFEGPLENMHDDEMEALMAEPHGGERGG
jgi:hypothetical protein